MTREQYLLLKFAEECNEAAKEAIKAAQFGLDSNFVGESNRERIISELNDLNALIEMLNREANLGYMPSAVEIRVKKEKVNHFYEMSKELGYVVD